MTVVIPMGAEMAGKSHLLRWRGGNQRAVHCMLLFCTQAPKQKRSGVRQLIQKGAASSCSGK